MNAAVTHSYVIFELGEAAYGLRSSDVLHVGLLDHITIVPDVAPAVEGVVFSRGQVVPALNLRVRFGLPRREHGPGTRLIFVQSGSRTVALIVDAAREFRTIPADAIRPVEDTLHGVQGNYIQGVAQLGPRLVLLVDVLAVIAADADVAALATASGPASIPQP